MGALTNICSPALIYLVFSITQISIDIFKGDNNTAFFKFIVMVIFTTMLNILCSRGLGIISWMLVFIPFMLMSFVTSILLIVFGIDPSSGKLNYNKNSQHINQSNPSDNIRKQGKRRHKRSPNKYDDDFEQPHLQIITMMIQNHMYLKKIILLLQTLQLPKNSHKH